MITDKVYSKYLVNLIGAVVVLLTFAMPPTVAQTPEAESEFLPVGFHIGQGNSTHLEAVWAAGGAFAVVVFSWVDIEPEPNYLYWEVPDAALRAAEFYGIELIARLDQPPAWALDSDTPTPWNLDAYANFTRRVAERYGDRLAGIILWNEANLNVEWNNQPPDAAAFAEMLKAAYPAVKAAAPNVPVLMGGLASTEGEGDWAVNDLDYLQALYTAGAGDYFDILSAHPYGFGRPPNDTPEKYRPNFRRLELYREIMDANGDGGKPVWVTELGWLTETDDIKSEWQVVSPKIQAQYIFGAIEYAAENYPWLEKLGIWQLNAHGDTYGYGIWHGAQNSSPAYKKLVNTCSTRSRQCEVAHHSHLAAFNNLPVTILSPEVIIRLGDRATLHPHWVHLHRSGYKFSPDWRGEFFLTAKQATQTFDLLIETMQITQPSNQLSINGVKLFSLHPRARPDITSTWVTQRFRVPSSLLQPGTNTIRVTVSPRNPARQYVTARWENMQFRHIRLVLVSTPAPPLFDDWQLWRSSPGGWSEANRLHSDPSGGFWLTGNRPGQLWHGTPASTPVLENLAGNRPDLVFNDILSTSRGNVAATQRGLFLYSGAYADWQPLEGAPTDHAYVVRQIDNILYAGFENEGLWQAPVPAGPWQRTPLTATTVVDLVTTAQPEQPHRLYAVAKNKLFFNDGVSETWSSLPLPGLAPQELQDAGEHAGDKLNPRLYSTLDGRLLLRHQDRFWLHDAANNNQLDNSPPSATHNWYLFGPEQLHGKLWSVANCCGPKTVVGTYRAGVWQLAADSTWQRLDNNFFTGTDITQLVQVDDTLFAAGDLGLFQRDDGRLWHKVEGLPPTVSDLLVDPAEPLRWVAGTPAGVYLSRDAGQTWQSVSPPWTVWNMAFGPQGRLFVGRTGGMVFTDDLEQAPVSWQLASGMKQVYFLSVNPHPIDQNLVWTGTWGNNIGVSNDGGQNIDPLHNGLETLSGLDILWHPTPGQVTLATIEGLYRTDNGGQSWFKLPGPLQKQTIYNLLQTDDGAIFAAAADGLWISRNYGVNWDRVEDIPVGTVLRLGRLANPAFNGEWLWAGTEGQGLWVSRDNGDTWQLAGLLEQTVYSAFFDPLQPERLVAATDAGIFSSSRQTEP